MSSGMRAGRVPAIIDSGGALATAGVQASSEAMQIRSEVSSVVGVRLVKILKYRRIDTKSVHGPGEDPGQPHVMARVLPEHMQGVQRCSPR